MRASRNRTGGKMSLQAALSKLRGSSSAVSSDDRRTGLTTSCHKPAVLPSPPPHNSGGLAFTQGAFDIPFDDLEEDDEVSSLGGLQCNVPVLGGGAGERAGPAPVSHQGADQSGLDQVKGGHLSAVEKVHAFSFTKLPQKRSISSDNVPSGKTPISREGVSSGQGEDPVCVADEEEWLSALSDDWLDTEWTPGARGREDSMGEGDEQPRQPQCHRVGEGVERPRQPQCYADIRQPMSCRGRGLLEGERQTVKRRFPGPAGALPQLPPGQNLQQLLARQPRRPPKTLCLSSRQRSCEYQHDSEVDDFSTGPWKEMECDLQLDSPTAAPLRKFTLSRVLKEAARKRLPSGKVSHLRVRLKTINRAGRNARVMMQDPTGEVCGTVHSEVVDELGPSLAPGAVLLLRQVSVVSPKPRRHYLNITASNMVALYPAEGGRRTTGSGDFDLTKLVAETLTNAENNKREFPSNGPSLGDSPLNRPPGRPVLNAPAANEPCRSHDQQPIGCLPDAMYDSELDDMTGVSIADFNDWDSGEEEVGLGEGAHVGQQQDVEGKADANASESITGSFFSDLLRNDELADFDEF